ncbi:hypothetical protein A0O36_01466 [Piscirickettsiaceae bacterium NZ-RLO1]|nr:hypothetical protein A0O36_01466 [Piscirickettsiaceae bacterium NZ-RLO1]
MIIGAILLAEGGYYNRSSLQSNLFLINNILNKEVVKINNILIGILLVVNMEFYSAFNVKNIFLSKNKL